MPRTSVRFAEHKNETILFCTAAYSKDLWYNRQDYQEWKRSTRKDARSWRLQGFGFLLENTFEDPSSDAQKNITAWARLDDEYYLRGIERQLNRKHDEERETMKRRAIDGFIRCQLRFQRRGEYCPEELAEKLSFLLREYSRPARRFAERIGIADAMVAQEEGENPNTARLLVQDLRFQPAPPKMARWSSSGSHIDATNAPKLPRQPMRAEAPMEEKAWSSPQADVENGWSFRSDSHQLEVVKRDCPRSPSSPFDEIVRASLQLLVVNTPAGY